MAAREQLKHAPCPVARALDAVGDAWSLLIVRDAYDGKRRFGEFLDSLGIARNILSGRLRKLVEAGILEEAAASDGSAYGEYRLTRKGMDLFPVVVGLRQWGEKHLYGRQERHSLLIDEASGKPILRMRPAAADGRPLTPANTRVRKLPDDRA